MKERYCGWCGSYKNSALGREVKRNNRNYFKCGNCLKVTGDKDARRQDSR